MQFLHLFSVYPPAAAAVEPIIKQSQDAGRAIALGVGAGGGAAGAGRASGGVQRLDPGQDPPARAARRGRARPVARLRAHRGVLFYGLVGGFIAFFL